jgi:hypothetical protein
MTAGGVEEMREITAPRRIEADDLGANENAASGARIATMQQEEAAGEPAVRLVTKPQQARGARIIRLLALGIGSSLGVSLADKYIQLTIGVGWARRGVRRAAGVALCCPG